MGRQKKKQAKDLTMQPLHPNPQDFVGANLRRAYRGIPPNALPAHLDDLLQQLAARLAAPKPAPRPAQRQERARATASQGR